MRTLLRRRASLWVGLGALALTACPQVPFRETSSVDGGDATAPRPDAATPDAGDAVHGAGDAGVDADTDAPSVDAAPDAPSPRDAYAAEAAPPPPHERVLSLTQLGDNSRRGANVGETTLTPKVVSSGAFGKLFVRQTDGDMYAEPLYVEALAMPDGRLHDVVFLATSHDTVYAYDADDPSASAPLWSASLGRSLPIPNPYFAIDPPTCKAGQYNQRESGITSTPVIDLGRSTLYTMALVQDPSATVAQTCVGVDPTSPGYCAAYACQAPVITYELHALDLRTGQEQPGSPRTVAATASGTGAGSVSGTLTFDARIHLQRPALLLANGIVYAAFGSYADFGDYHGWIMGWDAATLAQRAVFVDTPNGVQGGIWQGGRGPAADADGNLYVVTGNGTFDADNGGADYGDSVLKLNPALGVLDWFTPTFSDYQATNWLEAWDADLGSSGPMLDPDARTVVAVGKMGIAYVLDQGRLGGFQLASDPSIQDFKSAWRYDKHACGDGVGDSVVLGGAVAWPGGSPASLFVWGDADYLRGYAFAANGRIPLSASACFCDDPSFITDPGCGVAAAQSTAWVYGSAALAVSAYHSTPGTGIVWASHEAGLADSEHGFVPGVLEAFDASDISKKLWSSLAAPGDDLGEWAKFTPPLVANGKVYEATSSGQLVVYGTKGP